MPLNPALQKTESRNIVYQITPIQPYKLLHHSLSLSIWPAASLTYCYPQHSLIVDENVMTYITLGLHVMTFNQKNLKEDTETELLKYYR